MISVNLCNVNELLSRDSEVPMKIIYILTSNRKTFKSLPSNLSRRGHSFKGRGVQRDVVSLTHQVGDVPGDNERLVLEQWTCGVGKRGRRECPGLTRVCCFRRRCRGLRERDG